MVNKTFLSAKQRVIWCFIICVPLGALIVDGWLWLKYGLNPIASLPLAIVLGGGGGAIGALLLFWVTMLVSITHAEVVKDDTRTEYMTLHGQVIEAWPNGNDGEWRFLIDIGGEQVNLPVIGPTWELDLVGHAVDVERRETFDRNGRELRVRLTMMRPAEH